jgi:hypothetical protein
MLDVLIPYAKETLTITDTAAPLTVAVYKTGQHHTVQRCFITVDPTGGAIRYWTTGDTPVAGSEGHYVPAGGSIELTLQKSIEGFIAVRDASTSGILQVEYEKDY